MTDINQLLTKLDIEKAFARQIKIIVIIMIIMTIIDLWFVWYIDLFG